MVILTLGATVAFSWFGQSVSAMNRLKAEEAQLLAQNEALDYLRAINPVSRPQGEVQMPGYKLHWVSRVVGDTVRTLSKLGQASRYDVSLHELDVTLARDDEAGKPWAQFKLQLPGYKQVGSSSMSIFGTSKPGAGL